MGQPRLWWWQTILRRYTGPKGRFSLGGRYAALEGPLFHGTFGVIAGRDENFRDRPGIGQEQTSLIDNRSLGVASAPCADPAH